MKDIWNNLWKGLLIWVSSYSSIIAFVLAGGYVIVKEKDNLVLQKETKKAFIISLIYLVIDIILKLATYIADLAGTYLAANDGYSVVVNLVAIAKIITYLAFVIYFVVINRKVESAETVEEPTKEE